MADENPDTPVQHIGGWLSAVKGLTITNALVVVILIVAAIPAYFLYKLLNDETLLDRFLSRYEEISMPETSSCTLRSAATRGSSLVWYISTGFAYHGDDKWTMGVSISDKPTMEQMQAYCETLLLVVDYLHDPDHTAPSPVFPNSNDPVIRKYRHEEDR